MKTMIKHIIQVVIATFAFAIALFLPQKSVSVSANEIEDTINIESAENDSERSSYGLVTVSATKLSVSQAQSYSSYNVNPGDYKIDLSIKLNKGLTSDWMFSITCNSNLTPALAVNGDLMMISGSALNTLVFDTDWDSSTHEILFEATSGASSYNGTLFSFFLKKSANSIVSQPILEVYNYTLSSSVHFKGTVTTSYTGIVGDVDGTYPINATDLTYMLTIINTAGNYNIVTASNYELYLNNTTRSVITFSMIDVNNDGYFDQTDANIMAAVIASSPSPGVNYIGQSCSGSNTDSITVFYD